MTGGISSKAAVVREKAISEAKEYAAVAAYLFIVFSALLFLKSAILRSQGVIWVPWGFAAVKAAVLAKFVLIARAMHVGERFRTRPLIWEVVHRSLTLLLVVAILTVIEEAAIAAIHGQAISRAVDEIGGGTPDQLIATLVILFLVFLPMSAFSALGEVIGEKALLRLFFVERRNLVAAGLKPGGEGGS
ncbi:MAG TPA: hypothetical protein VFA23_14625 [Dongiaceae bacterium]|nr:hypothetical protein [Dongiaceae bacterium]